MSGEPPVQLAIDAIVRNIELIQSSTKDNFDGLRAIHQLLLGIRDLLIQGGTDEIIRTHANPLNRRGRQCFSQADEDGITMEILKRLGLDNGVFAEFGVGNGLENNTLILGALGWRGFWVGGEDLAFDADAAPRLQFTKARIDLANVVDLSRAGTQHFGVASPDVISLDLDGNDIYFVEALLEAAMLPRLFIVEYNAKFPPPVRFQIVYDAAHVWRGDDYLGASLASLVTLFGRFGYQLVCCNAHTGANAFFVRKDDMTAFADVPTDIDVLYTPPRLFPYNRFFHARSPKVAEAIFRT
jgi:hypothetical protein